MGVRGHPITPGMVPGDHQELKAVGRALHPRKHPSAVAIPQRDLGRKAPLGPRDGISVITVSQVKALPGGRGARRYYSVFTSSSCIMDRSRLLPIRDR